MKVEILFVSEIILLSTNEDDKDAQIVIIKHWCKKRREGGVIGDLVLKWILPDWVGCHNPVNVQLYTQPIYNPTKSTHLNPTFAIDLLETSITKLNTCT